MKGGIATRLAILSSLVALVATATVGFMVYRGARDSLMQSASDRLAHTAETIRIRTWTTLDAMGNDVRFLSKTPPIQGIVRARTRRGLDPMTAILDEEWGQQLAVIFRAFLESRSSYLQARFIELDGGGREIVRVERRGGVVVFAGRNELRTRGDQEYFLQASRLRPGQLYLSQVTHVEEGEALSSETPVMYIGTPVYATDQQVYGVVIVTVDFSEFLRSMRAEVDPGQTLYVADGRGEILHSYGRAADRVTPGSHLRDFFPQALEDLLAGDSDVRIMDARVGREARGIAYLEEITLDGSHAYPSLIFGVTEPHATILQGVRSVRNESALITILLCIAAIALALTTSRYLTTPLRQISRAVASFGEDGDRPPLPVDRSDEIGLLARTYEEMSRQIEDQIRVLADEERRQRTILETSAEGIIVTDASWRIETFNRAAETIFARTAGEVEGWHLSRLVPALKMDTGSGKGIPGRGPDLESNGVRPDGSSVPVSILWSPFEWSGERKYTIFVQDISERKESDEAREQLLRELESERQSLRELSASLEARVAERTAELNRANVELEGSNRELREIANVASHDLQEPLRKLRSFADLLESEYGGVLEGSGKLYVRRIYGLAERMSHLIGDLMAFSRVTSSPKPLRKVNLCRVVEQIAAEYAEDFEKEGGEIHFEDLPEILADEMQIRELFDHLVENALKHRNPDRSPIVHIRAEVEEDEVGQPTHRIEVVDNGIGFDQKYADKIFAPFERLHGKRSLDGTGMGLTICRRIAENHHGTISAQSEPGEGTTIFIRLPATSTSKELV